MSGNLKAFLEAAMADPDLREKLAKMDAGEIVAAARERGFELTEADLAPAEGEVNDEELGNVAGGGGWALCIAAGGGTGKNVGDNKKWDCVCILGGAGTDSIGADHTSNNCLCMAIGWGNDN